MQLASLMPASGPAALPCLEPDPRLAIERLHAVLDRMHALAGPRHPILQAEIEAVQDNLRQLLAEPAAELRELAAMLESRPDGMLTASNLREIANALEGAGQ